MIDPNLILPIGLGGIVGGELITFDYADKDRMKPYVCKILGRDFTYLFKREFVSHQRFAHPDLIHDKRAHLLSFKLEPFYIYEYKRFMGNSLGEIEEGYFGLWPDDVVMLEKEQVESMCGVFRERAIKDSQRALKKKSIPSTTLSEKTISKALDVRESKKAAPTTNKEEKAEQLELNFAPDDIPF